MTDQRKTLEQLAKDAGEWADAKNNKPKPKNKQHDSRKPNRQPNRQQV